MEPTGLVSSVTWKHSSISGPSIVEWCPSISEHGSVVNVGIKVQQHGLTHLENRGKGAARTCRQCYGQPVAPPILHYAQSQEQSLLYFLTLLLGENLTLNP